MQTKFDREFKKIDPNRCWFIPRVDPEKITSI